MLPVEITYMTRSRIGKGWIITDGQNTDSFLQHLIPDGAKYLIYNGICMNTSFLKAAFYLNEG